ncbi:MAG: hypothetical protein HQ517_16005 [SAR324 cluster bacterium]|nr:hypothetical protein [SAR324 cluster bacterium]
MERYLFYEIKSKKSRMFINGVRQVSLVCSTHPDMNFFLWLDEQQNLKHLQFVFNENIIEWFADKEQISTSQTNRRFQSTSKTGVHKGVRTIHAVEDDSILDEGVQIIRHATLPGSYETLIKSKLT